MMRITTVLTTTLSMLILSMSLMMSCAPSFEIGQAGISQEGRAEVPILTTEDGSVIKLEVAYKVFIYVAADEGGLELVHCSIITESSVGSGALPPPFSNPKCMTAEGGPFQPFLFGFPAIPISAAGVESAPAQDEPDGGGVADPGPDSGDGADGGGEPAPEVTQPDEPSADTEQDPDAPATWTDP